jgi:hypothetical protein
MRKSFYKKVIDWIDAHPFWAYVLGRKFNLWLGDKLLAVEKRSAKATSGLLVGIATTYALQLVAGFYTNRKDRRNADKRCTLNIQGL